MKGSEISERKLKIYGAWAGNPKGRKENEANCIKEIFSNFQSYQCSRKRGHGPDGLYCKQHDPERIAKKDKVKDEIRRKHYEQCEDKHRRTMKALALIEGIPTEELSNYRLVRDGTI